MKQISLLKDNNSYYYSEIEQIIINIQNDINQLPLNDILSEHSFPGNFNNTTAQQIKIIIEKYIKNKNIFIKQRITEEFFGFGPIKNILSHEEITEIIINGPKHIWIEKKGSLISHNDHFLSANTFQNFILKICNLANIKLSINYPFGEGNWNNFRIHICSNPVCPYSFVVSMRKHPINAWTFEKLLENNWASLKQINQLKELITNKKNFLIIGATNSGKTSTINAFLNFLNQNERTIIIEDTNELFIPNNVSTKLLTRFDIQNMLNNIDLNYLVKQALRMRPDRLVIGEIRGAEAKDLLLALSSGHKGSWGTLHAENEKQALLRLEMLIQMGAPNWDINSIRKLIFLSIDYLIVVTKNHNGQRILNGIYKICSLEKFGFLLQQIT